MKALIEIQNDGLASIEFEKDNNKVDWGELTKEEQTGILSSFVSFHKLFSRFIKPE